MTKNFHTGKKEMKQKYTAQFPHIFPIPKLQVIETQIIFKNIVLFMKPFPLTIIPK